MQDQRETHQEILNRLNRRLRTLYQCNSMFFQAESEQELLQSICEILVAGGDLRLAWIGYCEDDAEKTIRPVAQAGYGLDYLERVKISWGEETEAGQSPFGIAFRTGKPCWVDDIRTDPRFSPWRVAALAHGCASCIAVPLIAYGTPRGAVDLRGTLNLYSAECNAFDESAIEYYTGLAISVTYAVTALRSRLAEDLRSGVTMLRTSDERKRAQEALEKTQAELAHVTRVATMGELMASIAHEVNQPLAAIVTNANACLRWLAGATPNLDEARDAVTRILRDGNRASDVITRIRALVRKTDTEKARLNINDVVEEIAGLAQAEVRRNGVALRMELAVDLPPVVGDRVQLQQVILNLLMNGIEAMSAVTDRSRELLIRSVQHESDQVLVVVQDSGVGIDRENLEKIFNPFYTTKSQGMGMGLAICRSIVENHGGRLWAVPNDGPGATVQFTLPKYEQEA